MRFWVRAALVLAVLFFVLGLSESFEDPKAAAVRVCGLAAIVTAIFSWRTLRQLTWMPLDAAALAWLATDLLATLFSSAPLLSVFGDAVQREGFSTSLAMAGLYLGARTGTRDGADMERTLDVALAAITIASIYALFQAAGLDWIAWAPRIIGGVPIAAGRPGATLGHATILGVATSAAAAAALGRVFVRGRARWVVALAGAICVGATLVTLTRAAWLGLAAGSVMVVILLFRANERRILSRRTVLAGAGVAATIVIAALASGWGGKLALRFGELLHPERGSGASRLEIWRTALDAWKARPWLGWGPDTFGVVFSQYQTPALWRNEWSFVPFHAHSIYLQTLATRGVVGFASAALWVVALVATARAVWRRAPDDRARVAALLGMLAALAVSGAFGALGIAGECLIVVASGMLAARAAPPSRVSLPSGLTRAGILAAAMATVWAVSDLTASAAAVQAQDWLGRVSPDRQETRSAREQALMAAQRAAALAPADDRIACLHADALFAMADVSAQPVPLMLEATSEARRAVQMVPGRSDNHLRLGRVLGARVAMGDQASLAEARSALDRAAQLAPVNAAILGECARMDLVLGDTDRALALARQITQLYPDDGPSQAMLARTLVRSGDRSAGVAAFQRALAGEWRGDLAGREEAARELALLGL